MPRLSAGLLLFRACRPGCDGEEVADRRRVEVLLVHPGGPFWRNRDRGAWSLPKGEHEPSEDPFAAARREFAEELGHEPPQGAPIDLGAVKQPSGKVIRAWAIEGDLDVSKIHSNSFEIEWPPRSGQMRAFPEVDRAAWFDLEAAREQLTPGQVDFLDALAERLLAAG